jgi:hypothetical protein
MGANVIVWDIETVPDLKGFAVANDCDGKSDDEVRAVMGDKFPKHIYHSIVCIGALVAHQEMVTGMSMRSELRMSVMESRRRDCHCVLISIGTPKMRLISAMSCLRSVLKGR